MTNLDDATRHDPIQERLAQLREHLVAVDVGDIGGDLSDGVEALLAFARDVLEMCDVVEQRVEAEGGFYGVLIDEIRDTATRHLAGDQT